MRRLLFVLMLAAPSWAWAQLEELENPGSVSAVQERKYRMGHELSFGVGILPLDAFYKGLTVQLGYTVHFTDHFAWQVGRGIYSYCGKRLYKRERPTVANRSPSAREDEGDIELPDILTDLQDKTQLTRRSLHRILVESSRLDDFKRNPQQFIELTAEIINRAKRMALVDGIKYQRIGADDYYAQQLFDTEELSGYLKSMIDADKSVYEQVIYQSDTERTFADDLEKNEAIKVYAKLPGWFKVPTPLGPYNPDWAVLVEKDGAERLYFVVETKSSVSNAALGT